MRPLEQRLWICPENMRLLERSHVSSCFVKLVGTEGYTFPATAPMDNSATTLDTSAIPNNTLASGSAPVNQNPQRSYTNAILVRRNQKGNPLMEHLRNVPWQYGDILADYEVGRTTGVLFLR